MHPMPLVPPSPYPRGPLRATDWTRERSRRGGAWPRRRTRLEHELQNEELSEAERREVFSKLEARERDFTRLQRQRMSAADFEPLTLIGRGAFGEVRGTQSQPSTRPSSLHASMRAQLVCTQRQGFGQALVAGSRTRRTMQSQLLPKRPQRLQQQHRRARARNDARNRRPNGSDSALRAPPRPAPGRTLSRAKPLPGAPRQRLRARRPRPLSPEP